MINNRLTPAPYKEISTEHGKHGGVATVTFYFTSNYKPAERANATRAIVHEYDEKGRSLHRTYLILRQGVVIPSEEVCDDDFSAGFEDKIIVPRKKSKNHRSRSHSNQRPRKQTQGTASKQTTAPTHGSQRKTTNPNNTQRRNNNTKNSSQKRETVAPAKASNTTTQKKTTKRPTSTRKPPQTRKDGQVTNTTKKPRPQQTSNNTNKSRNQQKQRRPQSQNTLQPKASAESTSTTI